MFQLYLLWLCPFKLLAYLNIGLTAISDCFMFVLALLLSPCQPFNMFIDSCSYLFIHCTVIRPVVVNCHCYHRQDDMSLNLTLSDVFDIHFKSKLYMCMYLKIIGHLSHKMAISVIFVEEKMVLLTSFLGHIT